MASEHLARIESALAARLPRALVFHAPAPGMNWRNARVSLDVGLGAKLARQMGIDGEPGLGCECRAGEYLAEVAREAAVLLAEGGPGRDASWLRITRMAVDRLEGRTAPPRPRRLVPAALLAAAAADLDALPPLVADAFARRTSALLMHSPNAAIFGPEPEVAGGSVSALPAPWFRSIVETLCRFAPVPEDAGERAADEELLKRLARGPIVSAPDRGAFTLTRNGRHIRVEIHAGKPWLQEAVPGKFVLWEGVSAYVELQADELVGSPSQLPVTARGEASLLRRSNIQLHPFCGPDLRLCMADTTERYLHQFNPDLPDLLLHGRLESAANILRYGWRERMRFNGYRNYTDVLAHPVMRSQLVVVEDEPSATRWATSHPGCEIVRLGD